MAFEVAAGEAAAAVILILDVHDDFDAGRLRARVHGVGVFHHDVQGLRAARRDLVGCLISLP